MVLYGSNDGIPSSGSNSPTECQEEVGDQLITCLFTFECILLLTDLLLHGDEALVEGEVQAGVQRGHDLHHHLQPQLHGGDQHLELLGLHQHSTGRSGTGASPSVI